ncbi:MAG: hypothetical protein Q4C49_08695 [Bacillota bacterium]|nr:hypothetical protein [Bacillota bacterium]
MKKFLKGLCALTLALSCVGCQSSTQEEVKEENINNEEATKESMITITGTITDFATEENAKAVTIENEGRSTILYLAEYIVLIDAETRIPMLVDELQIGSKVEAYVSEAMSLSEPPIANAYILLVNVKDDMPAIVEVKETKDEENTFTIVSKNGQTFEIKKENCQVEPYKTRNMVSFEDITAGKTCIIWPANDHIVVLS